MGFLVAGYAMTNSWRGHELTVDDAGEFCPVQRFVGDAIRNAIGLRTNGMHFEDRAARRWSSAEVLCRHGL